jgi:hypothetical protein
MKEFWGLRLFLVMLSIALPHYAFAKEDKELLQSLSKKEGGANTLSNTRVVSKGSNRSFSRNGDGSLKSQTSKRER